MKINIFTAKGVDETGTTFTPAQDFSVSVVFVLNYPKDCPANIECKPHPYFRRNDRNEIERINFKQQENQSKKRILLL